MCGRVRTARAQSLVLVANDGTMTGEGSAMNSLVRACNAFSPAAFCVSPIDSSSSSSSSLRFQNRNLCFLSFFSFDRHDQEFGALFGYNIIFNSIVGLGMHYSIAGQWNDLFYFTPPSSLCVCLLECIDDGASVPFLLKPSVYSGRHRGDRNF